MITTIQNCNCEHSQIISLLQQLTDSPFINIKSYNTIISSISDNNNHTIYVYIKDDKPVGIITLIIEQKLIHGGKCVGHIEDLVVDKEYSGQGIAKELISYVIQIAKDSNCYKIILDCNKELIPFYGKNGFIEHAVQMEQRF
jgi:glucosamine-phosphate N-acetyltransferase